MKHIEFNFNKMDDKRISSFDKVMAYEVSTAPLWDKIAFFPFYFMDRRKYLKKGLIKKVAIHDLGEQHG